MCEAPAHRLGGFVAGAALATVQHQPVWVAVASAGIAVVTAAGRLSPDVDQYRGWRRADKLAPDELLGKGGPLQHRGLTHWWGLPLAALCVASIAVPVPMRWLAYALIAGWVSHLMLDWMFGERSWGRGPGIPLAPWFWHHGLGLDAGGMLERFVLTPVLAVAGPAVLAWPHVQVLVRTATTAWEATR